MQYTINGVNVSDYGIIPSQGSGTNIALTGFINLPARMGETSHDWFEYDGVEPYVLKDEISFAGFDLTFTGLIKGDKATCTQNMQSLVANVKAVQNTFTIGTPFGNFIVYMKSAQTKQTKTINEVTLSFHSPSFVLPTLDLPSSGTARNTINGVPFSAFGLTLKASPDYELSEYKEMNLTVYNAEKFKSVNRTAKNLTLDCLLSAVDLSTFVTKGKQLQKLFGSPGMKSLKIKDHFTFSVFAVNGFEVSGIRMYGNAFMADFKIQLLIYNEAIV